jgi:hypothetical protein
MVGFDHVVLLLGEKTVLGRKEAGESTWESLTDEIAAVAKTAVG